MNKKIALSLALMGALSATGVSAQTTATATIEGTVEQSLYIALDNTGQAVTFASSNAADFNAGYKQASGGVLTHKGNVTHTVSVAAGAASLTTTAGGRASKPASDVSWSTDGTSFTPLSTTGADVAAAAAAGEYTEALTYRMALDWAADKPATYSIGLTYTIAAD